MRIRINRTTTITDLPVPLNIKGKRVDHTKTSVDVLEYWEDDYGWVPVPVEEDIIDLRKKD